MSSGKGEGSMASQHAILRTYRAEQAGQQTGAVHVMWHEAAPSEHHVHAVQHMSHVRLVVVRVGLVPSLHAL